MNYSDEFQEHLNDLLRKFSKFRPDEMDALKKITDELVSCFHTSGGKINPDYKDPSSERPPRKQHPPVKSHPDGFLLGESCKAFADKHDPVLKYEGMYTALDVLTACKDMQNHWHNFHYEIMAYKLNDGVYVKKVEGQGHRLNKKQTYNLIQGVQKQ